MKKLILRTLLLVVIVSVAYAGIGGSDEETQTPSAEETQTPSAEETQTPSAGAGQTRKTYEPAGKFVPTEKLRADDAVAFPVDI